MNTVGICRACLHGAHCGHSCVDEECDYCTECYCEKCVPPVKEKEDGTIDS